MHTREEKLEAFGRLIDVLDNLREKCPWDRKQTNESLRPHTIEEAYELCDAIMQNEPKEIQKELGDVLEHGRKASLILPMSATRKRTSLSSVTLTSMAR